MSTYETPGLSEIYTSKSPTLPTWNAERFREDMASDMHIIDISPRPEPNNGWGRTTMFGPSNYERIIPTSGIVLQFLPAINYKGTHNYANTTANCRNSITKPTSTWSVWSGYISSFIKSRKN